MKRSGVGNSGYVKAEAEAEAAHACTITACCAGRLLPAGGRHCTTTFPDIAEPWMLQW